MQCPKWPTPGKIRRCGLVGYDFWVCGGAEGTHFCVLNVRGTRDPYDLEANFFNCVGEGTNISTVAQWVS